MRARTLRPIRSALLASSVLALTACTAGDSDLTRRAAVPAGTCPEPRATERAPDSYYFRRNPLPATAENLARGRRLYEHEARPTPCAHCHGAHGDGTGSGAEGLVPPPRNFRCAETMDRLTDGQLYWIIERGAGPYHYPAEQGAQQVEGPGRRLWSTAMRAYREDLDTVDIWQLVLYLRSLRAR